MKSTQKFFLLFVLTSFFYFSNAQTQEVLDLIDSMELYYASDEDVSHAFGLQAIQQALASNDKKGEAIAYKSIAANHVVWDNPDSAIYYVDKAVPIFSSFGDTIEILYCQQFRISALQLMEENLVAIELYKEMLQNQYVIDNPVMYYRIMQNLAILYATIDLYQSAIPLFNNVLDYYKSIQDTVRIINTSCDIIVLNGLMNYPNGFSESLALFDTAFQYTVETNDLLHQSILLIKVSNVYLNMNAPEKAKQAIEKALIIQEELGDIHQLSSGYKMMADIYIQEENYDMAKDYLYRSLNLDNEMGNQSNICMVFERMGGILQMEKNHRQAINYFNQAIDIAKEYSFGQQELDCIQARTISFAALENFDEAKKGFYEYLTVYNALKESDLIEKKFWEDELEQQRLKEEAAIVKQDKKSYAIQSIFFCFLLIGFCWLFFSRSAFKSSKKS